MKGSASDFLLGRTFALLTRIRNKFIEDGQKDYFEFVEDEYEQITNLINETYYSEK